MKIEFVSTTSHGADFWSGRQLYSGRHEVYADGIYCGDVAWFHSDRCWGTGVNDDALRFGSIIEAALCLAKRAAVAAHTGEHLEVLDTVLIVRDWHRDSAATGVVVGFLPGGVVQVADDRMTFSSYHQQALAKVEVHVIDSDQPLSSSHCGN